MDALDRLRGPETRCEAIIALSLNDDSPDFVEAIALTVALTNGDREFRRCAVIACGHSARRHRRLAFPETRSLLESLRADESIGGEVSDVLEDIEIFCGRAQ
jgi:hypothetical protein